MSIATTVNSPEAVGGRDVQASAGTPRSNAPTPLLTSYTSEAQCRQRAAIPRLACILARYLTSMVCTGTTGRPEFAGTLFTCRVHHKTSIHLQLTQSNHHMPIPGNSDSFAMLKCPFTVACVMNILHNAIMTVNVSWVEMLILRNNRVKAKDTQVHTEV